MRVLITGASGFAGRHLAALCREQGAEVTGLSRDEPDPEARELIDDHARVDLTDAGAAADGVRRARPERVFHLAAEASVARSWEDPRATIDANVTGALNLLEGVRAEAPDAAVLVAGSGETYGPVAPEHLPVSEDEPLRPQNPYAVSKAAVDLLAGFYADAHGMHVVRTRAFNHAGPGQSDAYAVASFARQIALAEADGADRLVVRTGDLAPRRDFT